MSLRGFGVQHATVICEILYVCYTLVTVGGSGWNGISSIPSRPADSPLRRRLVDWYRGYGATIPSAPRS
jgi:hypothetical protein